MYPSLETKLDRYLELEKQLMDPEVLANPSVMVEIQREYGGLKKVADAVLQHRSLVADIDAAKEMLEAETDEESREYAQSELDELQG